MLLHYCFTQSLKRWRLITRISSSAMMMRNMFIFLDTPPPCRRLWKMRQTMRRNSWPLSKKGKNSTRVIGTILRAPKIQIRQCIIELRQLIRLSKNPKLRRPKKSWKLKRRKRRNRSQPKQEGAERNIASILVKKTTN